MYSGICIGGTNAGQKKEWFEAIVDLEEKSDLLTSMEVLHGGTLVRAVLRSETYRHKAFHQREAGSGETRILGFWLHKSVPTLFDALVILGQEYAKNHAK